MVRPVEAQHPAPSSPKKPTQESSQPIQRLKPPPNTTPVSQNHLSFVKAILTAAIIDFEPSSNEARKHVDRAISLLQEWLILPPVSGNVSINSDEIRFTSTLLDTALSELGRWGKKCGGLGDGALLCIDAAQTRMYKWIGMMWLRQDFDCMGKR